MCYRELKYAYIWYVYCGIGHKHHADISHQNRHLKSTIFPLFWHKISAKSKLTSDASRSNVSRLTGPWSTGTTTHCPPLSFPTSPPLSFPLTGHPPLPSPERHNCTLKNVSAEWGQCYMMKGTDKRAINFSRNSWEGWGLLQGCSSSQSIFITSNVLLGVEGGG